MDVDKAFTRIKDDFGKSIQKGYNQAAEVSNLFQSSEIIAIKITKERSFLILSHINIGMYLQLWLHKNDLGKYKLILDYC